MSRRWMVVVGLLVVALAAGAYLLAGTDEPKQKAAVDDPLAEALAFAPAASPVVAQFDVQRGSQQGNALRDLARTFPAARFAADGVRQAVRGLGLDADADLPSILGGPVIVAGPASAARGLSASIASLRLDLPAIVRAGATAAVIGRSADDVAAVLDRATSDGRLRKLADIATDIQQYALPDGRRPPRRPRRRRRPRPRHADPPARLRAARQQGRSHARDLRRAPRPARPRPRAHPRHGAAARADLRQGPGRPVGRRAAQRLARGRHREAGRPPARPSRDRPDEAQAHRPPDRARRAAAATRSGHPTDQRRDPRHRPDDRRPRRHQGRPRPPVPGARPGRARHAGLAQGPAEDVRPHRRRRADRPAHRHDDDHARGRQHARAPRRARPTAARCAPR